MTKKFYFRASKTFIEELDQYKSHLFGNKGNKTRTNALGEALDSFEDYQLDDIYDLLTREYDNQEQIKLLINQGEEQKQQILHLSQIGNDVVSHLSDFEQ